MLLSLFDYTKKQDSVISIFQVAADNLAESTFEARRLVCDQVARKGGVTEVEITPQLLMAATGARQQYLAYLEEEKRKKAKEAKSNKRKKIEDEIHDVKDQRKRLKEDIESMETSAAKLADKAEATGKLAFISQSNSLRRTAQEKKAKLLELEKSLDDLLIKMKEC